MSETSLNSWKLSVISVFSRSAWVHEAITYLTMYSDNFCWPVRTLSERTGKGRVGNGARRRRRGLPITSGRCGSGSGCPAFNAVETPPLFCPGHRNLLIILDMHQCDPGVDLGLSLR